MQHAVDSVVGLLLGEAVLDEEMNDVVGNTPSLIFVVGDDVIVSSSNLVSYRTVEREEKSGEGSRKEQRNYSMTISVARVSIERMEGCSKTSSGMASA